MWIQCANPATKALGGRLPSDDDEPGERYWVEFNDEGRARTTREIGEHLAERHEPISIVDEEPESEPEPDEDAGGE